MFSSLEINRLIPPCFPSYETDSKGPSRWNILELWPVIRTLRPLWFCDSEAHQGNQGCSLEEAAVRWGSVEGPQGLGDKATGRETSQTWPVRRTVKRKLDLSGRKRQCDSPSQHLRLKPAL